MLQSGVRNGGLPDVTGLLAAWNDGEAGGPDRLVDLVYPRFQDLLRRSGLLP